MATLGDMKVTIDEYFTQTRLNRCNTVCCANRVYKKSECGLKSIEVADGKCASIISKPRVDLVIVRTKEGG